MLSKRATFSEAVGILPLDPGRSLLTTNAIILPSGWYDKKPTGSGPIASEMAPDETILRFQDTIRQVPCKAAALPIGSPMRSWT
ncbi:hypothetical protein BN77_p10609 [Rhizobium mesoamericanum STM3625]|uniref:Uncharacterized protein n=1 Tax=Rhizobium mesoamericanum STM3625 TaxID=1211777 RepID=K0Q4A3_9HYPH|nr:hypothetical protein BN77_p10609 [Rhizobium mesoamericanum STM3625]